MTATLESSLFTTEYRSQSKKLISRQDPVHGYNLVSRILLPPIYKCKLHNLPTLSDLLKDFRFLQTIYDNGNTKIVRGKWKNIRYCVCKTFNIYDDNRKRISKAKVNLVWTEYQLVKCSGLLEYGQLYYDAHTHSLIIRQLSYKHTLHQYIATHGPLKTDQDTRIKRIAMNILNKLWILHNCQFVHRDIKPSNIMERQMDDISPRNWIQDGWLLIDLSDARRAGYKGIYAGTIGWTAPEIDYNSTHNVFKYSCDIFSFGLVILFMLSGHQPLALPWSEMNKYYKKEDKRGMMRKQVHSNWYYGHVVNGENVVKNYLIDLYNEKKICYPP
eukprot:376422_1